MLRVVLFGLIGLAGFTIGCETHVKEVDIGPPVQEGVVPAGELRYMLNMDKLAVLPLAVRQRFQEQFPQAGVTQVDILYAATGEPVYEIVYLIGSEPGAVRYMIDGTRLEDWVAGARK